MPIDYSKYPPNWEEIRQRILIRDKNKCKFCGVQNHAIGFRDPDGKFHELPEGMQSEVMWLDNPKMKVIEIVLTIAHLDHDAENWNVRDDRLAALCQKCHNNYDQPMRTRKRLESKHKNQTKLF